MSARVTVVRHGDAAVIRLAREMTAANEPEMAAALDPAFNPRPAALVLDFAGVERLGTAAIGLLVPLLNEARQTDVPVHIVGASRVIVTVLDRVGIRSRVVRFSATIEEALGG